MRKCVLYATIVIMNKCRVLPGYLYYYSISTLHFKGTLHVQLFSFCLNSPSIYIYINFLIFSLLYICSSFLNLISNILFLKQPRSMMHRNCHLQENPGLFDAHIRQMTLDFYSKICMYTCKHHDSSTTLIGNIRLEIVS